jgi:hypothetical protein
MLSPPLANVAATRHESPSKFLIATKTQPPMLVLRNSAFMSFSASRFTMDRKTCPMMATELHPLKPNGQKKLGCARSNLIHPAVSKHEAPSGVRRWSLLELDTLARSMKACIKKIFFLAREEP